MVFQTYFKLKIIQKIIAITGEYNFCYWNSLSFFKTQNKRYKLESTHSKSACSRRDALVFWLGFGLPKKREDKVSACERDWKIENLGKQMCSAEVVQFA